MRDRRIIVSRPPTAPWWRTERAYRRSGLTGPYRRLPRGERWLWAALLIGCALLVVVQVAHLVAR